MKTKKILNITCIEKLEPIKGKIHLYLEHIYLVFTTRKICTHSQDCLKFFRGDKRSQT